MGLEGIKIFQTISKFPMGSYYLEIDFGSKNQTILMNQFKEKLETLIFYGIKGD